jgi:parallel beta-helix repeat protein
MKKRRLISFIIFIFLIGSYLSFTIKADQQKETKTLIDGHILYVGGDGPGNYSEIQDAVDNTTNGDTVFVFNGNYHADIIIHTSIQLIGEDRATTFIEQGTNGVSVYADGVTIQGFTITECGDFWNVCGIDVYADTVTIKDNNIMNNKRLKAIFLDSASFCIISNNYIEYNGYHGIRIDYSSHNIICNNTLHQNHGYGLYLISSTDNLIVNNTISQSFLTGIMLSNVCENNLIYQNNIFESGEGNSYDDGNSQWDNAHEGNFWNDYTGNDDNNDGIGDTLYLIAGGSSVDNYPLMQPYHVQPKLAISTTGGYGLTIVFENIGEITVFMLEYEINIQGGIFNGINIQQTGIIKTIPSGNKSSLSISAFGFGKSMIQINVVNQVEELNGFVLGPFILIKNQKHHHAV